MSLTNIKGKLSRAEMKKIMAGSSICDYFGTGSSCWYIGQSCSNGGSYCAIGPNGYCCVHGKNIGSAIN